MSLKDFIKATEKSSSNTKLKLEDGESSLIVLLGEPVMYYNHFDLKKQYKTWVQGCTDRFKWNVATKTKDTWELKILDMSMTVGKDLWALVEEFGQDSVFKITRDGSGKTTKYKVMYTKSQDWDKKLAEGWDLFDLTKYIEDPELTGHVVRGATEEDLDIPFKNDPAPSDDDMPRDEEIPF